MTFVVIQSTAEGDKEYRHTQKKIATRHFYELQKRPGVFAVSLQHQTRRIDKCLNWWERDSAHKTAKGNSDD